MATECCVISSVGQSATRRCDRAMSQALLVTDKPPAAWLPADSVNTSGCPLLSPSLFHPEAEKRGRSRDGQAAIYCGSHQTQSVPGAGSSSGLWLAWL